MKTKAQGNSALSFILLIAGIVLLVAALAMDVMGTKFAGRGAMLIFGIIAFFAGLYLIPTMKHHRKIVYFIFLFPLPFPERLVIRHLLLWFPISAAPGQVQHTSSGHIYAMTAPLISAGLLSV